MKTFVLVRVPYGKKSTPVKDREYVIEGVRNCPVGTIKEWKEFMKKTEGRIKVKEVSK